METVRAGWTVRPMGNTGKLPGTRREQDFNIKQEATRQKRLNMNNLT